MRATIALLPGDGVGPEVVGEAVRALRAVAERWGHQLDLREAPIGGCAIDLAGTALPDETLRLCAAADAVLLGAVGGPKWDDPDAPVRPEQGLLGLRKALGLFANLRPVTIHPRLARVSPLRPERLAGVDMLVVRELTGGIYFGQKLRERLPDGGERAVDSCTYTTGEVERIVRAAGALARARRGRLASVDKANVLETSRLWRAVASRVLREEFPDLRVEHILVDACAMHLIRRPADFDVIVTENMFGDILTDEAAMLAGSLGMLPSASLGGDQRPTTNGQGLTSERWPTTAVGSSTTESTEITERGRTFVTAEHGVVAPTPNTQHPTPDTYPLPTRRGLYEPIHGSAPDIAGRGVANPIAAILSAALLLRHSLGLEQEASAIEQAVAATIDDGCVTADIAAPGERAAATAEVGQAVAARLLAR